MVARSAMHVVCSSFLGFIESCLGDAGFSGVVVIALKRLRKREARFGCMLRGVRMDERLFASARGVEGGAGC